METIPSSEKSLSEECIKMIYNVFVYLKGNRKDKHGNPLTRSKLIKLTSVATGISMETITKIVYDHEGEDIVKPDLDIGPTEFHKPSSSIPAQEMCDRRAESVVVKQECELQEDVPSLDSPETQQMDAGPLGLLLPVKLEPDTDFIKREIEIDIKLN